MPLLIKSGAMAIGAWWPQPCASQHTHSQVLSRCSSVSVGTVIRQRPPVAAQPQSGAPTIDKLAASFFQRLLNSHDVIGPRRCSP
jgi:hypothetical protein